MLLSSFFTPSSTYPRYGQPRSRTISLADVLYILNHVFLPPKLPQKNDTQADREVALCRFASEASHEFSARFLSPSQQKQWSIVDQMLETLLETTRIFDKDVVVKNILRLREGEILVFHIHAQNAGLILRRFQETMIFEAFEVSPTPEAVMGAEGKLICSYPGPAVELPLDIAQDPAFTEQLVFFLIHMDVDILDAEATTTKAGSTVSETRGTTHPRYITQLLIMILSGMGKEAKVNRITKRIADDVCWDNARNPWRRSSLWLVLRVAIQTTADCDTYKEFMVFLHAELLRQCLYYDLPSDLIYAARVKTSRRVYKLGTSASPHLLQEVEAVGREIEQCLQARWSKEQRLQAISPSYTPDPTAFEKDTTVSLVESRAYLTNIMHPDPWTHTLTEFHPRHYPRLLDICDFHHLSDNGLTKATQADPYVALADFESLVQERLGGWLIQNSQDESACKTLGSCLDQYIAAAQTHYSFAPEAQSIMLLTIMELWVALDTIAVIQCPLLSHYSPEIPASVLNPLLLRRAKSIERATQIELYLRRRHSSVTISTSVYSSCLDQTMFAVQYFQGSPSLQAVRASIEQAATDIRAKKCDELQKKHTKYELLTKQIANSSCEYYNFKGQSKHKIKKCSKCKLQKEASSIRIDVHEWPLPNRHLEAEAVVFELNCPPVFAIWRTQTYQILRDIGMAHVKAQSKFTPQVLLEDYQGLAIWSKKGTSGRISFASETKSFHNSHYRDVKIPADAARVCVNNGLRFSLYDNVKGEHVLSSFNLNLDSYCTLRLPDDREGLYRHLQPAVSYTTHSHNETIVNQGDCPINLSLHEHLAFSNLRCGSQIQWKNIARELRTNVLTFSREEVHTLLTQAAWQIGPLSDDASFREWHFELGVSDFGLVLIREALDLLLHVQANWMEATTVKSIIYLISRLLASTPDAQWEVRQSGSALLRKAREVTYKWMRDMVHKLQDVVDDNDNSELQRRTCEMAATCRATFDVDPGTHLDALLFSSADVAIFIECSIVIHDNLPLGFSLAVQDFQKLLRRDRQLSHLLEPHVYRLIHADPRGLDMAIRSVWSEYRPGYGGWQQLPESNSRWLTSSTAPFPGQKAQEIHYNMLDGELLVDGKQLGRLPREIVGHAIYKRIFGHKILDVIPADMAGMDYATRFKVNGYQIFFALRGNPQSLIIRARTSDHVFELIPHNILLPDFPTLFSSQHAHWMNIHTGEVEFRPLDRLWEQSSQNWRLAFSTDGPSKMIHATSVIRYLIDVRSGTFKGIAASIHPLEHSEYLTVIYDMNVQSHTVSIDLPRLRLSFFLSDGELESKNMTGMVIDNIQFTGTMIGLRNQLVLRHKDPTSASLPRSRCVLIPYGRVDFSFSQDQHYVRVYIETRDLDQVAWYKYEIDSDLGLLLGNVNLTSRLYRIYLHALCSHPFPDPLIGQTGTDHALQELSMAGCFSFQKLTEVDVKLLRLIGDLTPCRNFYPKHLRTMQTTKWSPHLPILSQHGSFETAVCRILQYAQSLTVFPELKNKDVDLDYKCAGDPFLTARATKRSSIYYEEGIHISPNFDKKYTSRDSPHIADRDSDGIEAQKISRLVYDWPIGLTCNIKSSELPETFAGWCQMSGPKPDASLIYTQEWLNLDLPARWLSLYDLCRQIGQRISKKFELVFSFAAMAYSTPSLRKSIPILLAIATTSIRRSFNAPPLHSFYDLTDGIEPLQSRVRSLVIANKLKGSPARWLTQESNETLQSFQSRQLAYYKEISECKINEAVDHLMNQWPCSSPRSAFHASDSDWFDVKMVMSKITKYFASCSRNADLHSFASQVTKILRENEALRETHVGILRFCFVPQSGIGNRQLNYPLTLENLFSSRTNLAPARSTHQFGAGAPINARQPGQPIDTSDLQNLISQFQRNSYSLLSQMYSERLESSLKELHGQQTLSLHEDLPAMNVCLEYRDQCQSRLRNVLFSIYSALAPSTATERILAGAGLWPRIHPRAMLHPLASTANIRLSPEWAESLTTFAEAFIEYQYSQRLVVYALRSEADNFFKELDNASFNWPDARRNPDWLLIQIQGNFITRAIQSDVARAMITPSSGHNTVLQLNMGEGKSHVIVPLIAAALADSQKLVRIVVLKPLADQMFQLLIERISGLTNRRIFYLPFSRDVKIDVQQVKHIRNLFEECARVKGVLVAQSEHILSFRLMVIDQMLSSDSHVAKELQETQAWLTFNSRDIFDESDELLHVRYQLIYTKDEQQLLDGAPDRWTITQNILDLVGHHSTQLCKEYPEGVELLERRGDAYEGKFSYVRLLGASSTEALVSRIAEDALSGALDNLTFVGLRAQPPLRSAVIRFIKELGVDEQTYLIVKKFYGKSGLWNGLLLLRGLLAHGILTYVLSKQRWRVDYGLDLKRSLLAVPYRAKDMPSLRSEFGHPDVAVCLTCLSYYYGGLTPSQVQECFDLLVKLDNPPLEYEKWVKRGGGSIPLPLRQLIGVNMKDVKTFTGCVIPSFQHNKAVIDFFLSQIVFPKEAKEFPSKLGTSGWDLAEQKANFTTGFSGTNDNSDLLPTSIIYSDPVNQLSTNARVLGYLLRPENDRYICTQGTNGQPYSVKEFLELVQKQEVRVLLDVGAQMLEMTNQQLVEHWLSLRQDVMAAVFFDDTDKLSVLSRDGMVEPLYSSPFSQRLHQCIIYLDDAHTRGTDLKLPLNFRAAVTLGPKVTKDRLVQGCMRMRKLGYGQSVVFCAPPEVDRRIREVEGIGSSYPVKVINILSWVMSNTCTDIEHHIPHWVQQGVDHHNRQTGGYRFSASKAGIKRLKAAWLQPARRSLDEMYGLTTESFSAKVNRIPAMRERLRMLRVTTLHDVRTEEEQEREVSREVEQELQIERPPKVSPATHHLDKRVRFFVQTGSIRVDFDTFFPLLTPDRSESNVLSPQYPWSRQLLCTRDFMTTTREGKEKYVLTDYLRPVNWIVSHISTETLVVMSPYEVNILLQDIRRSRYVRLHMYAPRTTEAMKPIDDLMFYCIPPLAPGNAALASPSLDMRCQLNVWAGQLYLDQYETYLRLCLLLGISSSETAGYSSVESDRFVPERGRIGEMVDVCLFQESPLAVLKILFGLRRKGMSFNLTHMGKILHARLLLPEDFEQ